MRALIDDGRPGAHGHWKWTRRSRHAKTIYWLMVSLLVGTSCSPSPPLLKGWKSPWFLETGVILSQKAKGSFFTKNWGNTSKPLLRGYSAMNKGRKHEKSSITQFPGQACCLGQGGCHHTLRTPHLLCPNNNATLVFLITSTCFNVGTLRITSSKPENVCLSHTTRKEAQRG